MDWTRLCSSPAAAAFSQNTGSTDPYRVTPREVMQHCTVDDAWISFRGRVYNVTPYMHFHPGGVDQVG